MDLSAIGQQFGLTPEQTQAAVQALGPAVLAGMQRNTQQGGGGLEDILASLQGAPARSPSVAHATTQGNDILGQIFGSKDVSRGVAQKAATASGISPDILKKMLPLIAAFLMSQFARNMGGQTGIGQAGGAQGGGGLGDILGSILGGAGGQQAPGGGLGDILGSVLGGAGGGGAQSQQGGGLGDILGSILGGAQGSSGSDLLRSVEEALNKR
ncbi:DUF937 domain-containing protein [Aestuariivirga sp.]|uniref:DUF937 domain-containing protein n=1 Tax=Aestuariivirga sp. TaxID=2650926 RepID=UPI0039E57EC1